MYYVSSFNGIVLHSSKWTPKPAQTWFNWCKIMNESVEKGNALALTPLHIYLVPTCLNLTARVPSIVYRYIYLLGHWVQVMHLAEITTQYRSNSFSVYQRAKSRSMISRVWIPLKDRTFVSWPFPVAFFGDMTSTHRSKFGCDKLCARSKHYETSVFPVSLVAITIPFYDKENRTLLTDTSHGSQ